MSGSVRLGTEEEPDRVARAAEQALLRWARRYGAVALGVVVLGAVVGLAPSTLPERARFSADFADLPVYGTAAPASGAAPAPAPASASVSDVASVVGGGGATDVAVAPADVPPASSPSGAPGPARAVRPVTPITPVEPDAPVADPSACPLPLPDAGSATLPTGAVLTLAGPVLPLIGPFVPAALAALPLLEPVLPAVLPLVPLAEPFLIRLGSAVTPVLGPIVEVEGFLIQPVQQLTAPLAGPALQGTQFLVTALDPVLDLVGRLPVFDCIGRVEAELVRQVEPFMSGFSASQVRTTTVSWRDGLSPAAWRSIVDATQDRSAGVVVRLVASAPTTADRFAPERFAAWVTRTVASLPQVSGFEIVLDDPLGSVVTAPLDGGTDALRPAVEAALRARRVGQLVGVGAGPSQIDELSRTLDGLPTWARKRVNFVDLLVPPGAGLSVLESSEAAMRRSVGSLAGASRFVSIPAAGDAGAWVRATERYQLVQFDVRRASASASAAVDSAVAAARQARG